MCVAELHGQLRLGPAVRNLLTTPQEGRNAVLLINAMYESAREKNGGWVRI